MARDIKKTLSGSSMNRRENDMRPQTPNTNTPKIPKSKPFAPPVRNAKVVAKDIVGSKKKKKPSYYSPSIKSSDYQLGDNYGVRSQKIS